jgi:peptide chain release factor subunit 1
MTAAITDHILRELAAFHAENGCAISIYLDFDPSSTPTIPDVEAKVNAVLSRAEKEAEGRSGGRDCRASLRADLARLRGWWDGEFDRDGARGVAVFASSEHGFFRAVPLAEPAGDAVRIGHELYVAPLAAQPGRDGSLVAVVSRERGTVYRYEAGRLEEVLDSSEEQPGQHDQGGWSQARYQRHIENLVQQHLKNVGGEIDRTVRSGPRVQLVVVAPEELRGEIEKELSNEVREAVVGWATAEAHATKGDLLEVVRPLLDEARARQDAATLARWQEARGRGERSAAGWKQVLDAASDGRVDVLLLEGKSRTARAAWSCPRCGRASADGGRCPLDDARLEETEDGADLALHRVLAHGGSIVTLGAGALGDSAGIAALLRF